MTLIFKQDRMPPVVVNTLLALGWVEHDEKIHDEDEWNIHWKPTRPTMGEYSAGKSYQRLIHFPKTGILCTKDNLARLIKRNKGWFGKIYHFTPQTYCLPNETKQFMDWYTRQAINGKQGGKQMWICKPTDLSRGRKITIIDNLQDLQYDQQSVIQEYIGNPLLIRGTKWDMRIYVLITQMRPLKVYLFREGIVRFSSERYNTNALGNLFSHLTNSSINKYAATNISDGHGSGLKWSFAQLRSYFVNFGYDFDLLWAQIEQIIVLTCINLCSLVPDLKCCFELLGFDIMLDEAMKPWLLEVNSSPAMSMETDIDLLVKPALIKDAINLCPFESYQDWLERSRSKQTSTTKTSNIHKNFFSKRTTAMNKKDEGVSAPIASQSQAKMSLRQKDTYSQGARSAKTDKGGFLNSQYSKTGNKLDQFEQPYAQYATSNFSKKNLQAAEDTVGAASMASQPNLHFGDSSFSQSNSGCSHPGTRKGKQGAGGSITVGSAGPTIHVKQRSMLAGKLKQNISSREGEIYPDSQNSSEADEELETGSSRKVRQSSSERVVDQDYPNRRELGESQAERRQSKNLISSYSSASNNQQKPPFQSKHTGSAKRPPKQFESMLPSVGLAERSNLIMAKKRSAHADISMATGSSTRGDSDVFESSSRNQRREPFTSSTRNNTNEVVPRKTPVPPRSNQGINSRLPPHMPRSSMTFSSNLGSGTSEHRWSQPLNEEPEMVAKTEEQIEADKQKRQARLKQQNELNSRLSVKKSALSKMLDAQRRKERIQNGCKMESQNNTENSGFRGTQRNRASRLDDMDTDQQKPAQPQRSGPKQIKIPDNYQLPPRGQFDKEQAGQFDLIFPFNGKSEELAQALNRQVGARASMGAPNFLKMLVQEIKQQYDDYLLFIKNGRRYAPE